MDRKAIIITNDSKTVNNDADKILNYYGGGFKLIEKLEEELREFCEVETYIISKKYGLLGGEDSVENATKNMNQSYSEKKIAEKILPRLENKDIIVILLKRNLLEKIVLDYWKKIIDNIKNGTILCMSMSSSLMEKIDVKKLEKEKDLRIIIYERKCVARLDKETKNKFMQIIKEKYSSNTSNKGGV